MLHMMLITIEIGFLLIILGLYYKAHGIKYKIFICYGIFMFFGSIILPLLEPQNTSSQLSIRSISNVEALHIELLLLDIFLIYFYFKHRKKWTAESKSMHEKTQLINNELLSNQNLKHSV